MPADRCERLHSGDRATDYRTPGQRDRDRVLYTSSLRRLGAVTQVVSPIEGILFHNRLTHTLEVAQIGRRMAERLVGEQDAEVVEEVGGLDPDVVEAAALVHDLGHPPFGHAVEKELDKLVTETGVPDGYEGNAQSFRIVTKLAIRNPKFPGLNLTRATLNATLKYPWTRETSGYRNKKWGSYGTEKDEFDWAREMHERGDDSRSVEAELMDWADDIAYAVHDVEDFYRVDLIPLDRLRSDDEEIQRFVEKAMLHLAAEPHYQGQNMKQLINDMVSAFKEAIWSSPMLESFKGTRRQRAGLRSYTATLINRYINAVQLVPERAPGERVEIDGAARNEVDILKQLTRVYVIENPALATQQYGQRRIVRELFEIYKEAADSNSGISVVPAGYKEQIEVADNDEEKVRTVSDMISSMTEQQLLKTHRRLTGREPGSVMDIV